MGPNDVTRAGCGLAIVAVTAQQGDNAYRIFESLNNTGLKLTQADLLRNYLFMRLPNRGEAVYQSLRGYGIVDLVSSSGALMMPSDDSKEASGTVHC